MTTHTLTTEQLHKLVAAIGDDSDWPKHTDDPRVNYAIDCVVHHRHLQDEEPPPPYNENLYVEEVEASKKAGLGPAI